MANFWSKLPKPFFAIAPMADVTDPAFRRMFSIYGKPDVMWTEFVSADGLMSAGREVLLKDLRFVESERPIVAQIFGSKPEAIEKTAALIHELGFDGVDINMGCPDKNVEKQGAGASLIKNPSLAKEIIIAAKQGAKSGDASGIPVSVKTRIGYSKNEIGTWISSLLETRPAALTIHARTRKEMSLVPARWEHVAEVVEMAKGSAIPIIGNGDVVSRVDGIVRAKATGCDGIMVGRGVFGNPWFFNTEIDIDSVTLKERFLVMLEHTRLFVELNEGRKSFSVMKKHYKAYVHGFSGAKELRMSLMETEDAKDVEHVVNQFMKENQLLCMQSPKEFFCKGV